MLDFTLVPACGTASPDPSTAVGAIIAIGDCASGSGIGGGDRAARRQRRDWTGRFAQPSVPTFGPADRALALADATICRLSARVWGEGVAACPDFAGKVPAETLSANGWTDGDDGLPCGGFRQGGAGRAPGQRGQNEFLEVKTVPMRFGRRRAPWVRRPADPAGARPNINATTGGYSNA